MITFRELTRILEYSGVQPDMTLSMVIHADTEPSNLNVLIEDSIAYITEKRT